MHDMLSVLQAAYRVHDMTYPTSLMPIWQTSILFRNPGHYEVTIYFGNQGRTATYRITSVEDNWWSTEEIGDTKGG